SDRPIVRGSGCEPPGHLPASAAGPEAGSHVPRGPLRRTVSSMSPLSRQILQGRFRDPRRAIWKEGGMGRRSRSWVGVTLIELLVVIAIIAILAAVLFPVLAQAREMARQTTCLSNMQQLARAQLIYLQDWDEHLPHWWEYGPSRPAPYGAFTF